MTYCYKKATPTTTYHYALIQPSARHEQLLHPTCEPLHRASFSINWLFSHSLAPDIIIHGSAAKTGQPSARSNPSYQGETENTEWTSSRRASAWSSPISVDQAKIRKPKETIRRFSARPCLLQEAENNYPQALELQSRILRQLVHSLAHAAGITRAQPTEPPNPSAKSRRRPGKHQGIPQCWDNGSCTICENGWPRSL